MYKFSLMLNKLWDETQDENSSANSKELLSKILIGAENISSADEPSSVTTESNQEAPQECPKRYKLKMNIPGTISGRSENQKTKYKCLKKNSKTFEKTLILLKNY